MKEKLKRIDRFATGVLMFIICSMMIVLPVATDGTGIIGLFADNQLYVSDLSASTIIIVLLLVGGLSGLVLSVLSVVNENVSLNVIGVLIGAIAMTISVILIMTSNDISSINYNYSFWTIALLIFSGAGYLDAIFFKKFY